VSTTSSDSSSRKCPPRTTASLLSAASSSRSGSDALQLRLGDSRPAVDDADEHLASCRRHAHVDGLPGRGELERVLEQVDEHALQLDRVDLHHRGVVGEGELDPARLGAELVERLRDEPVHGPELAVRLRRARLQAGEVEEVADDALQPLHLVPDRLQQAGAIGVVERKPWISEALGRDSNRSQRRAQVVAHGLEDGRLDRVAPAQRLGLDRLAAEPLAVDRHRDEGGERR